jgi:Cof subfamily protein (haloacid dehalogenase superfamily)
MKMIKAAFFDMDGTLFSHETKCVPESTRQALQQLRKKGIACIMATGRQMSELAKLPIGGIVFDGYLTLNGQILMDKDKNVVFSKPITGHVKEFLLSQFQKKVYPALLVEERKAYLNCVTDHVREAQATISSPIPPVDDYSGGEIYQVCAYLRPHEEHFLAPISEDCVITRWHFGGMDVIAKGGGKVSGMREYLDAAGLKPEEIIAFGDGENDIEMLRFAGIGVAMGNAVEEAKKVADYVTADIDDDGIEKALKHLGLIE